MTKYFLAIIVALCLLPMIASAAGDDVQFLQNTNIYLTSPNLTLVVQAGSTATSMVVNPGNVVFNLDTGSQVTIISTDKKTLSADPAIATTSCGNSQSQIVLTGPAVLPVTITPGDTCAMASIGGAGGGFGGGGGGTTTTTTPITATPTITAGTGTTTATASGGGQATLTTSEGTTIAVVVPAGAVNADTAVNVVPVATATAAIAAASAPTGQTFVSAFNINASAGGTAVTTFTQPVVLTFTYNNNQVVNLNEASLQVYRYNGTAWTPLPSTVNAATNTITATTTGFSYFAIMGQAGTTKPITAMTIEELNSEIARIAALILQLQTELVNLSGTPQSFATNLSYGLQSNADVKRLQEFLISKGYLSSGLNTGNYLSLTMEAVKAYQTAKGITPVSGYFGPKTQAAVSVDLGITQ